MKRIIGGLLVLGTMAAVVLAAFRVFVPDEGPEIEKPRFLVVQEIFETWRDRYDCASMDSGIVALKPFLANTEPLPGSQIQTVALPKAKTRPTIGDLALDRTIRLRNIREQLCP